MQHQSVPFSPPRIDQVTIDAVTNVLKSGWITTGPQTMGFESDIEEYIGGGKVIALNSWTNACELVLRWFNVGEGDEVVIPAYTYAATANIVKHVGATPVMVDSMEDGCWICLKDLEAAITDKTKVIMPVDVAGNPVDYDAINALIASKRAMFNANGKHQEQLGRILFLADAAHSFGAEYKGKKVGNHADVTGFSFHAVKNLTTAEGGALVFNLPSPFDNEAIKKRFKISSLHGQTKDALSKTKAGAWRYDVIEAGFKCNMTDMQAAIGRVELERYSETLAFRKRICDRYTAAFASLKQCNTPTFTSADWNSSYHLYLLRLNGFSEDQRDAVITKLAENGVSANVHFQPLPLLSFYKNLGYTMSDYPKAFRAYENEISLPVWYGMTDDQIDYVIHHVKRAIS